ncbi:MAG: primosomal protein N' [Lachnospiraceae bacterium]|nr:primosomal protein N' [Lachnospiraceae bacterium]
MYADVIVNVSVKSLDRPFTYAVPAALEGQLKLGYKVDIPFGAQQKTGYIVDFRQEAPVDSSRVREILGISKRQVPADDRAMELAGWMKERYGCTMHQAIEAALPVRTSVKKRKTLVESVPLPEKEEIVPAPALTADQEAAVAAVRKERAGANRPCLLFGVTGSGKTEVYMRLIADEIAAGRQTILLIPEIGLTYQNLRRFRSRFGSRVGMLHSQQSQGEKTENLERARRGELDLLLGPRSALFAPFPDLGLIIIDEEHDGAYRSDLSPRYQSREVAEKLAQLTGAGLVLGSATPSLESYQRCLEGSMRRIALPHRAVAGSRLAAVSIVDLRQELKEGNKSIFSRLLVQKTEDRLARREQVMLFLNRRGYAGFVSCRSCGKVLKCPHCDVSLTLHREHSRLHCHYCEYRTSMPDRCPECGSPYIGAFGTGTQKVETLVQKAFPEARVLRMDADTTAGKGGHSRILSAFSREDADILVGTQMIVKGHDFPHVTLVGILAADLSLHSSDYRSAEETFALLTQAAGRAGRSTAPGEVVIQTYQPSHYAITSAAAQDYDAFFREEMSFRRLMHYPPAGGLLSMSVLGKEEAETERTAQRLKAALIRRFSDTGAEVIGPAEGVAGKLKDVYRRTLFVKHPSRDVLLAIRNAASAALPDRLQADIL